MTTSATEQISATPPPEASPTAGADTVPAPEMIPGYMQATPPDAGATAAATPTPADTDPVAGADALKEAVTQHSMTVGSLIEQLDSWGFTVGDTRFSVWSVLVVLVVLAAVFVLARLGTRLAHATFKRFTRLDPAQQLLGEKLLSIAVWALALFIGIDVLGIDLTALAVFSGAFGLAIGFGLQKTFGNLIAGIILLMDRSIKPGDVIAIADQAGNSTFGQIRRIGLRAVSITTRDQREYLIPNENLMVNQVENWSYSSRQVRMQIPVGVSYHCDIRKAEELMLEAAKSCPRVLNSPPPTCWLDGYGNSSVDFVIHCWITDPEQGVGNVRSEVLKKLWDLFQENNIEIPFPQRDLNFRDNAQFQQLVAAISQRVEERNIRQDTRPDTKPDIGA
ncbi:small-conductance mechanosensitive channel [Altererythrobacter atlanticus]|uniref:MscS family protein.1 n=1 Tax=Croceibacterium atlanticum TaxID=1267766 RepID=A0A0F7KUA2_9SPHN|nr:mechanosensitive ion channel domain-containing protein [Croceibacterium atlanticum]AKH42365.1 putative MscS family protein.1 precursor [Croceibacterium atlanticum]MBB5731142.1 small-conductance mechanosensitive channel [Croceibacterium atlanticum]